MNYLDRFSYTWASEGPTDPFDPAQIPQGFDVIGDAPPTVEEFNDMFKMLDQKDNFLFGQIKSVTDAAALTMSLDVLTTLRDAINLLARRARPVGVLDIFTYTPLASTGYLPCDGRAVSRTTYATLFSRIGVAYGPGNGSTTFNLPDLRGRVPAGSDDIGGTRANRLTNQSGTTGLLGAAGGHQLMQSHDHGFVQNPHTHTITLDAGGSHSHTAVTAASGEHSHTGYTNQAGEHTHTSYPEALHPGWNDTGNYVGQRGWGTGTTNPAYNSTLVTPSGQHDHNIQTYGSGNHNHDITVSTIPGHTHTVTIAGSSADITFNSSGGGDAQNMPPFQTFVYGIFTGVFT